MGSPEDIHSSILRGLAEVISESLVKLFFWEIVEIEFQRQEDQEIVDQLS